MSSVMMRSLCLCGLAVLLSTAVAQDAPALPDHHWFHIQPDLWLTGYEPFFWDENEGPKVLRLAPITGNVVMKSARELIGPVKRMAETVESAKPRKDNHEGPWVFTFDHQGRRLTFSRCDKMGKPDATYTCQFWPNGQLRKENGFAQYRQPDWMKNWSEYNHQGRLISRGVQYCQKDAYRSITTIRYDAAGREVVQEEKTPNGSVVKRVETVYDRQGAATQTTWRLQEGKKAIYNHRRFNRRGDIDEDITYDTGYGYPGIRIHTVSSRDLYHYTAQGKLKEMDRYNNRGILYAKSVYTYTSAGKVHERADYGCIRSTPTLTCTFSATYSYDARNRVTRIVFTGDKTDALRFDVGPYNTHFVIDQVAYTDTPDGKRTWAAYRGDGTLTYDSLRSQQQYKSLFTIEYDAYGNWTKAATADCVWQRAIEYY